MAMYRPIQKSSPSVKYPLVTEKGKKEMEESPVIRGKYRFEEVVGVEEPKEKETPTKEIKAPSEAKIKPTKKRGTKSQS